MFEVIGKSMVWRDVFLSYNDLIVALATTVIGMTVLLLFTHKNNAKIPQSSPSMSENVKMLQNQKGLTKMMHIYNLAKSFKIGDWGRGEHGATFQFKFPTWNPFLYTTEYELARIFLQGEFEQEKTVFMKTLNTIDRDTSNILTHYTDNVDREKARKALAPSFSTSNLQQTWPFMEAGLIEEFEILRKLSRSGELLDCRNNVLMFLLRMLGRSAFGIEFTDDGTENESNINGLEYLEVQGTAASVRMNEMSMPFRQFYFWDKEVQEGERCTRRLKEMSQKMLKLYEQNEQRKSGGGGGGGGEHEMVGGKHKRQSIMQAIAHHAYPTEKARTADINVMTFAGHDTTGFSFCFLLMELGRHPEIRAKLQAEIATVMPKTALGESGSVGGGGRGADGGAEAWRCEANQCDLRAGVSESVHQGSHEAVASGSDWECASTRQGFSVAGHGVTQR